MDHPNTYPMPNFAEEAEKLERRIHTTLAENPEQHLTTLSDAITVLRYLKECENSPMINGTSQATHALGAKPGNPY